MKVLRGFRKFGSIAAGLFLLAGLPGLALASGSDARPATAGPTISGTVTALIGGAPLAGIQVAVVGESDGAVVTAADGTYVLPVVGSATYEVMFTDPALKYLQACYDTDDWGNANVGCNQWTDVPVNTGPVDGFDVQLMEGEHITGTVTGPATPANKLAGVQVQANDPGNYTSYAKTAADGTYSLTVPAGDFSVTFNLAPYYARACYWDGTTLASSDDRCTGAVTVGFSDVSAINAQLGFGDGTTIAVTPDGSTIAAGMSATFVATLNAVNNLVVPAGSPKNSSIDVTSYVSFSMTGGSCTGAVCTPSGQGDHTVTATYGAKTGTTVLHSGAGVYSAPVADPTAHPTAPPTSTAGSGSSQDGLPMAMLLLGLLAAAVTTLRLQRRIVRPR